MATEAQIRVICETCLAIVLTTADPWLLYISCLFVSISGKNTLCLCVFCACRKASCGFSWLNTDIAHLESIMQNKPNLLNNQMNVTSFYTVDYENIANWTLGENKPKQSQFARG